MSADLWSFTVSPVELMLRGTVMYLGLVLVLRFLLRRDIGGLSVSDVLFIVLIADAAQNAMAGEYTSLSDGIVLVGTLVAWNLLLDGLAYRFPAIRRVIEPPALPLIRNGSWVRRNLKREWITVEEVTAKLREQGIDDLADVRIACLESSGELSVLRRDAKDPPSPSRRSRRPGA